MTDNETACGLSGQHPAYHAHVYYAADSAAVAHNLCQQAGRELGVKVGRFHDKPIGPHPLWSCQLSFAGDQFERVISHLRQVKPAQMSILVHALTGDDLADHTRHAGWLGAPQTLRLDVFKKENGDV